MTTLKNLTTTLALLVCISLHAQETDSAYAMLSESIAPSPSTTIETEASLHLRLKTTKYASFDNQLGYQSINEYLKANLKFPEEAKLLGKTGMVKVVFDILPNGSIENIEVLEAPLQVLSDELVNSLKTMPKWSPAYQSGIAVKTRQQVNVDFSLL